MNARRPLFDQPFWSPRQLLLAAGFAAAGALAWWQLQTRPVETLASLRARLPDHVVLHFSGVETDATGQPSRRLAADALRYFVAENLSELDQPRLELLQTSGAAWTARAERGLVFAGGDQVRLLGAVQLEQRGAERIRPAHLATAQLDVWRERSLAATELPVRIDSDGDTLTANGMQFWYGAPRRTVFHGRTRIQLTPAAVPATTPN